MSLWQTFKDAIGYEAGPEQQNVGDLMDGAPSENRITMLGTPGAGKSAHLAGLLIAADRLVAKSQNTNNPFRYYLREGSGNIEHDKSALRAGHFPPKTGLIKQSTIETRVTFEWARVTHLGASEIPLSKRQLDMPICDLAGEDVIQLIEKVNAARTLGDAAQISHNRVAGLIIQSSGFLLILKATRAQGLEFELEKEPEDEGLSIYSDANMKRMLDGVVRYKKQNKTCPALSKVGIIVTAWDGLAPVAEQISTITGRPWNPLDKDLSQEALDKFMQAFYPSTYAAIKSLHLKNLAYFPSFFEVERDSMGTPICWDGTDSPKIKKPAIFDPSHSWEDNVNTVLYSEYWFFKELEWLQGFAALG